MNVAAAIAARRSARAGTCPGWRSRHATSYAVGAGVLARAAPSTPRHRSTARGSRGRSAKPLGRGDGLRAWPPLRRARSLVDAASRRLGWRTGGARRHRGVLVFLVSALILRVGEVDDLRKAGRQEVPRMNVRRDEARTGRQDDRGLAPVLARRRGRRIDAASIAFTTYKLSDVGARRRATGAPSTAATPRVRDAASGSPDRDERRSRPRGSGAAAAASNGRPDSSP